ncbi:MAG: rod shape-determining protein RodA [Actinobacteria bacterium]|nr:rod shape-determining protein RodA [Actinomycetota bacterium]
MIDWRAYLRHLDYALLLTTVGLVAYGITMVYFASRSDIDGAPLYYVRQQLIAVGAGVIGAVVASVLDYELYRRFQWLLYAVAVFIVVAVLPLGEEVNGATRWIDLGFTRFQPSSAAVLLLALSIGAFLSDRMEMLGSKAVTVIVLVMAAVPAFFVYREPDFGSAMVIVVLALGMLFFYGAPWTHFAVLAAAGVAAFVVALKVLPLVGIELIHQYQLDRLFVFVDPGSDASGAGYNVIQSMIAVGSGALTGRGDGATQTTLDFLPEHHTDFIFAVISERNGFLGASILLVLYALFIWRALRIAVLARDMYGSILAGGIAVAVLFQVFVNIGMTIGIMPVTGIPLPFISYGGTAMIAFLLFVGLLQAIHLRATITPEGRRRLGQ